MQPPRALVIVGGGGLAVEAHSTVMAINRVAPGTWRFQGFIDRDPANLDPVIRQQTLGSELDVAAMRALSSGSRFVVAVGDGGRRQELTNTMESLGLRSARLIDPRSTVGERVTVGGGAIILPGSTLTARIRIGAGVLVNPGCTISHDVELEDYVSVSPGANLAGGVRASHGSTIHSGAVVLPRVHIGEGAVVGAGAVVTENVEPYTTVVGIPARTIRSDLGPAQPT